jgi:hypothetical protein
VTTGSAEPPVVWNQDEAFEAHIAPTREALTALLDASDQLKDEKGSLPDADSAAMAEIAAEASFEGISPWGDKPVGITHDWGNLLLFAMSDCARALVRLLSQEKTPVYAQSVLARACLEHASRAWSLFEPSIGVRRRIARGMNERVYGFSQQIRLPLSEEEKAKTHERRELLFAEADRLGFTPIPAPPKRRQYLDEMRPGQTHLVKALLRESGDESLGALLYGLYSAVAHGTPFGLTSSVTTDAPNLPSTPGVTWGAVHTNSLDVVASLTSVIIGTAEAYDRRNKLFGWASPSWSKTVIGALDAAKKSFPSRQTT